MTKHVGVAVSTALCALALIIAFSASQAFAALQLSVGNPGLQHFDSNGAVELNFGLTNQNGQPVGNLEPDNVKVFEDGKPAKIVDFRGVGQGRPVDIVFVIDVTESMQPYIDAVKQNIIDFAHELAANNRDYRLGLVTFEDYTISKYPDCNCAYRNKLTSNVNQFVSWVSTLHAGGGGDIPEDQLDALAYAATLPYRPNAEAILILITDAPCHVKGDGPDREGDAAYRAHKSPNADVTELTGPMVAAMLKKQGLTLYAVAPPPFVEPAYYDIVKATHGRLYNIITEQGRFSSLVREIGHTIATEYSLTYITPRPIEDGTNRSVELKVTYDGQGAVGYTSYQVRGIGGAVINVPSGSGVNQYGVSTGYVQVSFSWWNAAVPLLAILGLVGLSRMKFGVSAEELRAIVQAQGQAPSQGIVSAARQMVSQRQQRAAAPSPPATPRAPSGPVRPAPPPSVGAGVAHEARLTTLDPVDPVPSEYALLKDEITIGRGEDNDVVIPHPSVSRVHARLLRRNGRFELVDLNSTNGTYVNNHPIQGATMVNDGNEVRLGDIRFVLHC